MCFFAVESVFGVRLCRENCLNKMPPKGGGRYIVVQKAAYSRNDTAQLHTQSQLLTPVTITKVLAYKTTRVSSVCDSTNA